MLMVVGFIPKFDVLCDICIGLGSIWGSNFV